MRHLRTIRSPPARTGGLRGARVVAVVCLLTMGAACEPGPPGPPAATTTTTKPASCRGTGSTATKGVAYHRVAGVDPNLLSLDHYSPNRPAGCGPAPVVV